MGVPERESLKPAGIEDGRQETGWKKMNCTEELFMPVLQTEA